MSNMRSFDAGVVQRNILIALCAFLAVVLILLAFGTVYIHDLLNHLDRFDQEDLYTMSHSEAEEVTDDLLATIDPDSTETLPNIEDVTLPSNPSYIPQKHGEHVINIMLVGQDRRPGEGRQRSDSMMLVTFNTSNNTITLTSFMRDQYVQIPGYKNNKLNAAYAWGGFKLMNSTLEQNFGVFVDGNLEVDFDGFRSIVDMLGGVEITLTQEEADHLNEIHNRGLTAGPQLLDGVLALEYSRIRKIDSDYRRAERQRTVMLSVLNRYKDKPANELLNLLKQLLPMITTNLTNDEILSLAGRLLPMISTARVNTLRIPVDGTFQQGDVQVREGLKNWFQYNIDFETNRAVLQHVFAKN